MSLDDFSGFVSSGGISFATTHWSAVRDARDRSSPGGLAALEKLCRAYWYPLYSYVRRRGVSPTDAEDLTQEFFYRMIGKNYLESVDPKEGSFRSFLLASVNHLLANEWNKARTLKRGGGHKIISLDAEEAEGRFVQEPTVNESPERGFDRRWAVTLLERALTQLREEFTAAGKLEQFDSLKVFLSDVAGDGDYVALAGRFGIAPGGVAVAVHRLRLRYRELVRAQIAETVSSEAELADEMNHLFAALD